MTDPRPILHLNPQQAAAQYGWLSQALPGVRLHYAVKCNPAPSVLEAIDRAGGYFEIASSAELDLVLQRTTAAAPDLIFSHPVKAIRDIEHAFARGVRIFMFDSECEVDKLADAAPGARVVVRMSSSSQRSLVASEGKFGVSAARALDLLLLAESKGLHPYGVSFHVGSQMLKAAPYVSCIKQALKVTRRAQKLGMRLEMLDIGGGFPGMYCDVSPRQVNRLFTRLARALSALPPALVVVAEPGRAVVASAGTLEAQVIGVAKRGRSRWVHLNLGAFNGVMEALETANRMRYPIWDSRGGSATARWNVTGPTCDSQDSILFGVPLSVDLAPGDSVFIGQAGAYTLAYTADFNGFGPPVVQISD